VENIWYFSKNEFIISPQKADGPSVGPPKILSTLILYMSIVAYNIVENVENR